MKFTAVLTIVLCDYVRRMRAGECVRGWFRRNSVSWTGAVCVRNTFYSVRFAVHVSMSLSVGATHMRAPSDWVKCSRQLYFDQWNFVYRIV